MNNIINFANKSSAGQKKSKTRLFLIVFFSICFIAFVGLYSRREKLISLFNKGNNHFEQAAYVKIETISADETIQLKIVQNMSIEAVNRVKLLPRVTGRLEKLHVKKGDHVTKGQIVATLEHKQQDSAIDAAQASVSSSLADTERAKAEMMNAKTNLERYKRLIEEGFSTQQQYDAVETTYTSAKATYNATIAKQRQLASELNRVRSTRKDYIIRSPLNGIVLNDYSLTDGAMISPNTAVLDIADLSQLKATLKIPESKIFIVKEGMPVSLKFDALPEKEFFGKITKTDSYVTPETRSSNVEIALNNKETGMILLPGMFGQASIIEKEKENSIVLPEAALRERESGYYVFTVKENKAVLSPVEIGIKQNGEVEITKGLTSGEKVVVFGGNNIKDGDSVQIQE